MKITYILGITLLAFSSCQPTSVKHSNTNTHAESTSSDLIFDYDNIEYYSIDLSDEAANKLRTQDNKSEQEDFLSKIIFRDWPGQLTDLEIAPDFKTVGFNYKNLNAEQLNAIHPLLKAQDASEPTPTNCLNVYRDILIFKKEGKITGVIKVCFDCNAHYILGTDKNSNGFGQNGGYEQLKNILKK